MTEIEYLRLRLDNTDRLAGRLCVLIATLCAPAQEEELAQIVGDWGQVDAALDARWEKDNA